MTEALLEIQGLSKQYSGITVLENINLHVGRHEIVGLVGENGAGKSTILNVLCGVANPWTGRILLDGQPIRPRNYHEATLLGIARVFQEQALVPNLTVYEHMLLSHEDRFRRMGLFLNRGQMANLAREKLHGFGLELDVRRPIKDYDFSTRQAIEIAKACHLCELLCNQLPLILLDEPTAALNKQEVDAFFTRLRILRSRASVVFVSHRLSEVLELCDRIYVLKDGRVVAEVVPGEVGEGELHELMVGRKRDRDYYKEDRQCDPRPEALMRVDGFTRQGAFEDVSLELRPGEILGIGGLLGSGKAMVGRALAAIEHWGGGRLQFEGENVKRTVFTRLMRRYAGYVPQERHLEGIILYLSVVWNTSLASIDALRLWLPGLLNLRREKALVARFIQRLGVKTPSNRALAIHLSGGNQQKVVMAKWLMRKPKILILDNPTRGMDAGAKEDIYGLMRELTQEGMAILLISDELLELIGMSNRILIMKDGRVTHRVEAPPQNKPTERELVQYMV